MIWMPYLADLPQLHPPLHRLSAFAGECNTAPDSGIYSQLTPSRQPHSPLVTSRFEGNERQQLLLASMARTLTSGTESRVKASPACRLYQKVTQNTPSQAPNLKKALIHQSALQSWNSRGWEVQHCPACPEPIFL